MDVVLYDEYHVCNCEALGRIQHCLTFANYYKKCWELATYKEIVKYKFWVITSQYDHDMQITITNAFEYDYT